ncbi:unnamed protein product [Nippostrongylus brasiliensis]|uniref:Ground-like domain-containing protein n=1 Tax=Nippostrongylus brasiliensis TaxID=27835 RepID=A0A0N4XZY0_NIPBR|nr:unnamed protein product [Nippostrongylus brasiliensis]
MRLLVLLSLVPLSSAFLWNLLSGLGLGGGGGGGYAQAPRPQPYFPPQQSPPMMPAPRYAAPPPPSYSPPIGGGGGGYAQSGGAGGYVTAPGGYRRRNKRAESERQGVSTNVECNSDELKEIIKKVMTNDETETRSKISAAIQQKDNKLAVFCTPHPFKFTVSNSADFCAVKNDKFTCYAFVF